MLILFFVVVLKEFGHYETFYKKCFPLVQGAVIGTLAGNCRFYDASGKCESSNTILFFFSLLRSLYIVEYRDPREKST